MRLPRLTDYAVVLALAMAQTPEESRSATSWSQRTGLPTPTVAKILRAFRRSGLTRTQRGRSGGYGWSADPSHCSLRHVVEALDGKMSLTVCHTDGSQCAHQSLCRAQRPLGIVQRWWLAQWDRVMLNDLLDPSLNEDTLETMVHARWGAALSFSSGEQR